MNVNWLWSQCQRHRRDIHLLASGVLTEAERSGLDAHLAICSRCRAHHQQITRLARDLSDWRDGISAVEPDSALRTRWERAVASAAGPAGVGDASRSLAQFGWVLRALSGRRAWFAGLSVVWLLILFFNVAGPDTGEAPSATTSAPPRALLAALTALSQRASQPPEAKVEPAARNPAPAPVRPRGDLGPANVAGWVERTSAATLPDRGLWPTHRTGSLKT